MIGVVIAVRDQARYVGEAIDSVLEQTVPAERLIVVDDGSTDGTGDVARERGVEVVTTQGIGPSPARSLGAEALETEYLCFLDGDDRFVPRRNELLLDAIGQAPAVGGRAREFFDPGREAELAARFAISAEPLRAGTLGGLLIRRSAYLEIGGFPDNNDEHDFFGFVRRLGEFPQIEDVVLERRIHGANRSIADREDLRRQYLASARAAILASREGRQS
jgi:glycosyltransferase involved in cell wall biosynthesis